MELYLTPTYARVLKLRHNFTITCNNFNTLSLKLTLMGAMKVVAFKAYTKEYFVVCFLLGDSLASPSFLMAQAISEPNLFLCNTPNMYPA